MNIFDNKTVDQTSWAWLNLFSMSEGKSVPISATVSVADAAADTTTWVLLGTSQTGNISPATDAGLTYNSSTNALTATTFVGALTGNADTATTAVTVSTTVASGAVGTTQTAGDNSTKIATTAYADRLRLASAVVTSSEQAIPAANTDLNFAHGLSAIPSVYSVRYRCKTAEYGYSIGDEVDITTAVDGDGARNTCTWVNTTNVGYSTSTTTPQIRNRTTGGTSAMTNARWKLIFRAWL